MRRKTLRRVSASRVRVGLAVVASDVRADVKTGAEVPPGGALVRRRSAIASIAKMLIIALALYNYFSKHLLRMVAVCKHVQIRQGLGRIKFRQFKMSSLQLLS